MASSRYPVVMLLLRLILLLLFLFFGANGQGLKVGFYEKTCPNAEAIVKETIDQVISVAPSLGARLLRLHFHDCFVRGCDASLLLNSTRNNQAEKDAPFNGSLRGFEVIDRVKLAVEKACPGVVSCADILALVARDATVALKGPYWQVETGRRDGRVSLKEEAVVYLPAAADNITTLIHRWYQKGLSKKDLVVLSGAHTIGTSHCDIFTKRLYNFTGKGDTDPSLDPDYIVELKEKCKPDDQTTLVDMDPGSPQTFDRHYYTLVSKNRGLFQSDSALLDDPETRTYVKHQVDDLKSNFFEEFGVSMVNMGRIQVLTGSEGEIRKICSKVN